MTTKQGLYVISFIVGIVVTIALWDTHPFIYSFVIGFFPFNILLLYYYLRQKVFSSLDAGDVLAGLLSGGFNILLFLIIIELVPRVEVPKTPMIVSANSYACKSQSEAIALARNNNVLQSAILLKDAVNAGDCIELHRGDVVYLRRTAQPLRQYTELAEIDHSTGGTYWTALGLLQKK